MLDHVECKEIWNSWFVTLIRECDRFGKGTYTTSTSSKAAGYSKNRTKSPYKAMILNKVAVGKPYFTGVADNTRTAPPSGFDSVGFSIYPLYFNGVNLTSIQVCGLPGDSLNHDETIVYNDGAIRPTYLIIYDG